MPKYVIVILVVGGVLAVLLTVYLVWDIYSTYFRMVESMG